MLRSFISYLISGLSKNSTNFQLKFFTYIKYYNRFGDEYFGPQMALAYRLDGISQGPKTLDSRAQTPPTCPRNEYAPIQNIMPGAV